MTIFGIIGAMDVEIAVLLDKMKENGQVKTTSKASLSFYEGKIGESSLVLVKSGVGKVNAALCAQILISEFKVTHLINTGIAGALSKNLHILDIILSTDTVYHDFQVTAFGYKACTIPRMESSIFQADTKLMEKAKSAFEKLKKNNKTQNLIHNLFTGRISSGDCFVDSKETKQSIVKDVKELDGIEPIAVEMEGTAIAHVASLNAIPFLIIRTISDTADESVEQGEYKELEAAEISSAIVEYILEDKDE